MDLTMSLQTLRTTVVADAAQYGCRDRIADAMRRAVANSPSPAKALARALGLSPPGAAKLLRAESAPSAETLLRACQHFDVVWAEVQAIAQRVPTDAEALLDELERRLLERRK